MNMSKEVKIALIGAAATILAAIISGIFLLKSQPASTSTSSSSPTAPPTFTSVVPPQSTSATNSPPTVASGSYGGTLKIDDPLSNNKQGYQWQEDNNCLFAAGAYHIRLNSGAYIICYPDSPATHMSNFALQVQMTIHSIKTAGGIIFRLNTTSTSYYELNFNIYGHFVLTAYINATAQNPALLVANAPNFRMGTNQSNLIALVVQGNKFDFYVNQRFFQTITDEQYSSLIGNSGPIGMSAETDVNSADVEFSHIKVWTL